MNMNMPCPLDGLEVEVVSPLIDPGDSSDDLYPRCEVVVTSRACNGRLVRVARS